MKHYSKSSMLFFSLLSLFCAGYVSMYLRAYWEHLTEQFHPSSLVPDLEPPKELVITPPAAKELQTREKWYFNR